MLSGRTFSKHPHHTHYRILADVFLGIIYCKLGICCWCSCFGFGLFFNDYGPEVKAQWINCFLCKLGGLSWDSQTLWKARHSLVHLLSQHFCVEMGKSRDSSPGPLNSKQETVTGKAVNTDSWGYLWHPQMYCTMCATCTYTHKYTHTYTLIYAHTKTTLD